MLGVVLGIAMVLIVLERTTGWKIFRFVPGMVMMYLLMATLNSLGVFGEEDSIREPIAAVKDAALPAMIFLFLFGCDLRWPAHARRRAGHRHGADRPRTHHRLEDLPLRARHGDDVPAHGHPELAGGVR